MAIRSCNRLYGALMSKFRCSSSSRLISVCLLPSYAYNRIRTNARTLSHTHTHARAHKHTHTNTGTSHYTVSSLGSKAHRKKTTMSYKDTRGAQDTDGHGFSYLERSVQDEASFLGIVQEGHRIVFCLSQLTTSNSAHVREKSPPPAFC